MVMMLMDILVPTHVGQLDDALVSQNYSIPAVVLLVMNVICARFIPPLKAQNQAVDSV